MSSETRKIKASLFEKGANSNERIGPPASTLTSARSWTFVRDCVSTCFDLLPTWTHRATYKIGCTYSTFPTSFATTHPLCSIRLVLLLLLNHVPLCTFQQFQRSGAPTYCRFTHSGWHRRTWIKPPIFEIIYWTYVSFTYFADIVTLTQNTLQHRPLDMKEVKSSLTCSILSAITKNHTL